MKMRSAVAAMALLVSASAAAVEVYKPQGRFNEALGGSVIDDWQTGVRWKRCLEGMQWSESERSCKGEPKAFTYYEALELARSDPYWELPDPNEFRSIIDCGNGGPVTPLVPMEYAYPLYRCEFGDRGPTVNEALFPQTPDSWHWAKPRYTIRHDSRPFWIVSFGTGSLLPTPPYYQAHVRLMNHKAQEIREAYNAEQREKLFYQLATDEDGMETYLANLPNGKRATEVRERLDDLLFAKAKNVKGMQAYLERFPEGKHADQAAVQLDDTLAGQAQNVAGMIRYLDLLPNGKKASAIRERLEQALFVNATTEDSMEFYLSHFPGGERSPQVKKMLSELRLSESKEKLADLGYVPVGNGQAIYHQTSGLTWSRCSLGQSWDEVSQTCRGKAKVVTHSDVKRGLSLPAGWRLPHPGELRTLYECDKPLFGPNIDSSCSDYDMMINRYVFPGTPDLKRASKSIRDGYYFTQDGAVVAFNELKSWDSDFLSRLSDPTKGFVRLVKGEMEIASNLCESVGIYRRDAQYLEKNRLSRGMRWDRQFLKNLPITSFEYHWREAAMNTDQSPEFLMRRCRESFGVGSNS